MGEGRWFMRLRFTLAMALALGGGVAATSPVLAAAGGAGGGAAGIGGGGVGGSGVGTSGVAPGNVGAATPSLGGSGAVNNTAPGIAAMVPPSSHNTSPNVNTVPGLQTPTGTSNQAPGAAAGGTTFGTTTP